MDTGSWHSSWISCCSGCTSFELFKVIFLYQWTFLDLSYFQRFIPWVSPKQIPDEDKACSPEVQVVVSWSLQPGVTLTFTSPASLSLFVSMRSSRASLCTGSSISYVRKFPRKSLHCLQPAVLPLQQKIRLVPRGCCFYLPVRGLNHLFFRAGWPRAEPTAVSPALVCSLILSHKFSRALFPTYHS